MAQAPKTAQYQHEDAWDVGWLRVDETHELYYQQFGKKDGKPVIYLHGGPGGNCSKSNTVFFDPEQYRVILLDQRGCGQSRPNANTTNNTTWHLVADIETLRKHLQIFKWHIVFGGSWGSTLALAYAQTHPSSVGSLVLRGIFAARAMELQWTNLRGGVSMLFPDHYENFINFLPEDERADLIANYHKRLMSPDPRISHPAAIAWNTWEISISTLYPDEHGLEKLKDPAYLLAHARIEVHYFTNKAWMEDGQLLKKENVDRMRHIPTTIVQGRYDVVCPPVTAWGLHQLMPESKLHFIADAGHSVNEPGTKKKLTEVCDEYLSAASFPFDVAEGPPPSPMPSSDITLNALVQHGVHRMECDRAFLSLIDNRSQFICAEMTRYQPLGSPDPEQPLLLGTSRIALEWGVCPYTMSIFHGKRVAVLENPYIVANENYFFIKDFRQVPSFATRPYVAGYPRMVSYIEIPLCSLSGHIVGSYCVVDNKKRDFLQPETLRIIREVTAAISSYLNMKRVEAGKSRSERMMDGLRHFVGTERPEAILAPGATGSRGARIGPFDLGVFRPASQTGVASDIGGSGSHEQSPDSPTSQLPLALEDAPVKTHMSTPSLTSPPTSQPQPATRPPRIDLASQIGILFSKAANTIGLAMELDGLVFFDTVSTGAQHRHDLLPSMFADGESVRPTARNDDPLAIPLSQYLRGDAAEQQLTCQPSQSLIQRLTARYPQGHVFAVDEYGVFEYGDKNEGGVTQHLTSDSPEQDEWSDLFTCVPKARYVVFLPLWHYQRESCYATCLVWVSATGKTLDTGDVNSLTAFGNSLMAEIFRLEALTNTQSKSDFVSSISHELRSPLHGILATIELMQENNGDSNMLPEISMIDSCASTLLDIFDHLLEFSKVNSRAKDASKVVRTKPNHDPIGAHGRAVAVDLSSLVEDVLEGVSLGHNYTSQFELGMRKERQDLVVERLKSTSPEPVVVTTYIEKDRNWTVPTEKGAWKRILLNIFSNALKYTEFGHIDVNLKLLEEVDGGHPHISLSVTDTGRGMSQEFLKYHLYAPFTQENILSPGTGLGLSIVKSIVQSLNGKILVESRLGEGTRVTVNVPCSQRLQTKDQADVDNKFLSRDKLRGLTLGLLSISSVGLTGAESTPRVVSPPKVLERSIRNICEEKLGMIVTDVSRSTPANTNIVLLDTHALTSLHELDLESLFPRDSSRMIPQAVVVLGISDKGMAQDLGVDHATYMSSPVTGKRLWAALLSAVDRAKARGMLAKKSVESVAGKEAPNHTITNGSTSIEPTAKTVELPFRNPPPQPTLSTTPLTPILALSNPIPSQILPPQSTSPPAPAPIANTPTPCRFRRLLLVDDNLINLKVLSAFAKRLGVPFSTATDGAEAVRLYQEGTLSEAENAYDCIFMDITMPIMDGFQAVAAIRTFEGEQRQQRRDTSHRRSQDVDESDAATGTTAGRSHIFALTGLGSEAARKEAKSRGFDEFLLKPVKFRDILPFLTPVGR
ncbi:hypothetical protein EJ02DRAFT_389299 [Clathrospora elynae]|uniref:Uncharacterized protein n=1 Tax=Clathrospora elynae TaxID=706981 RepID=A0A6A5S400_9PLEO|nr:hypothetical protein EJ02DRAFT_389299 [Clathrospora elynae]